MNATNMTPAEVAAWEDLALSGRLRYALATENDKAYQIELARHVARLFPGDLPSPRPTVVVAPERPRRHPVVVSHRKQEVRAVTTATRSPEAHIHRWRCESPSGPIIPASCKDCGASRTFPATPAINSSHVRAW